MFNELFASDGGSPLGIVHIVIYFAILFLIEVAYQIFKFLKPRPFLANTKDLEAITLEQFNHKLIKESKALVLLDNLVLDVTDYMDNHPGGKFLLEHNIGRDISKFFYGGYALDNNDVKGGSMVHTHSNMARLQVSTLIIGKLIPTPNSMTDESFSDVF